MSALVIEQAANRLHLQKALMAELVKARVKATVGKNGVAVASEAVVAEG